VRVLCPCCQRCLRQRVPPGFRRPHPSASFDNIERGAVFDAAAGVLELGFSEDGARGFGGQGVEFYEGSVADLLFGKTLV
jgi:hypothetical protein